MLLISDIQVLSYTAKTNPMNRFKRIAQLPFRYLFTPRQISLSRYDLANFALLLVLSFLIVTYKIIKQS